MTPPSIQNLKAVGLWVFFLIYCSTFSFLFNVGLRLTLRYLTRLNNNESDSHKRNNTILKYQICKSYFLYISQPFYFYIKLKFIFKYLTWLSKNYLNVLKQKYMKLFLSQTKGYTHQLYIL